MIRKLTILTFAILFLVAPAFGLIPSIPDGYAAVTSFTYNITSGVGAQSNYPIKFTLSNASGISGYYSGENVIFTNGTTRPDWFDINATDASSAPIPFWIENGTQTAKNCTAWVKVPAIAVGNTSTGKWYYGNSSQDVNAINGLNVFPYFSDWGAKTAVNTSQESRVLSGGTDTFSGGMLIITTTGTATEQISSKLAFGNNNSYRIYGNFSTEANAVIHGFCSASAAGCDGAAISVTGALQKWSGKGSTTARSQSFATTSLHLAEMSRYPATTNFSYNNTYQTMIAGSTSTAYNATLYSSTSVSVGQKWMLVRPSVYPEPTTSVYSTTATSVADPILASFIQSIDPSNIGQSVNFNDTSTGSPTTWNWTIEGVGITNTTQHISYTFATAGTYYIDLNVTNASGSFSNITQMHNVTNVTGFTPEDIWMEGEYLQTFYITDSSTGLPIPVVELQDTAMQTYTTTNGTGYLTEPFGASTVVFIADDYNSKAVSYFFDSAENHSVQLSKPTTTDPSYQTFPPEDVKFHIVSFFGAPIPEATVSVLGVTTSTGNWDWLITLFGIPLDEVAINGTAMNETTDSNGDAVFLMLSSVKYNITVTAAGYTFPSTVIAPQAKQYTIYANMNSTWFGGNNNTLLDINTSVSWVRFNDTHAFVNVTYEDESGQTTAGDIRIYRDDAGRLANATPVAIMNITSSSCSNSTLVNTPTGGSSYRAEVSATSGDREVIRTFNHYFKGPPVIIPGFTSETMLWMAMFIMIFTAAFAGALHSPQMAVILCVESWVFWSVGWLDALISVYGYGEAGVIGYLLLASFITVWWNIAEGKAKGKRQS